MTPPHTLLRLALAVAALGLSPGAALADPSPSVADPRPQSPAAASAQSEYDRGVRARVAKNWPAAVEAFLRAVTADTAFPEAWNELGYALRNQGRYTESLAAYDEALRLRPDFPEALEYLGEAYVKLGRLEDARRILERLRALDPPRAEELAEEIAKAR